MRRAVAAIAALVVTCGLMSPVASGATTAASRVAVKASPPGQVSIAAVNARQNKILGLKRFEALLELARAFRSRPLAFNGGTRGAVHAPDVAVISEFRETNVEVYTRLMRQKFDEPYELVGPTNVQAALIVNTRTVELQGEVQIVEDVCMNDETSDTPRLNREYPFARFKEIATGAMFTVGGVHLARDYSHTGIADCLVKNVVSLRDAVASDPGAAFIAGDFNYRPTMLPYECDPLERGEPTHWWNVMNGGEEEDATARQFVDAVQWIHHQRSMPMNNEWTYEHPKRVTTCTGADGVRRSRIDYIFSSGAEVAEAHADHPGWSVPGNFQYSDHRFVLGRFVITGPPRALPPAATQVAGGVIQLAWEPLEGAAGWIVYRARPEGNYAAIARLTGDATSYTDSATTHEQTYRYALAAIGADSGQGVESRPTWEEADARGPAVTGIVPARGAERVGIDANIRASFNEWVAAPSVGPNTISVYRNGNPIPGRVIRKGGFVIKFDPTYPLRKGETYTIVVRPVSDVLGNTGATFRSRFSTVEPKKRRHRR